MRILHNLKSNVWEKVDQELWICISYYQLNIHYVFLLYETLFNLVLKMSCNNNWKHSQSYLLQRAMKNKWKSSEQKSHWLYYADDKYDVWNCIFLFGVAEISEGFYFYILQASTFVVKVQLTCNHLLNKQSIKLTCGFESSGVDIESTDARQCLTIWDSVLEC